VLIVLYFTGGLSSFLTMAPTDFFCIEFNVLSGEAHCRIKIAKRICKIFRDDIHQQFGGHIERLHYDDAMVGLYHEHLPRELWKMGDSIRCGMLLLGSGEFKREIFPLISTQLQTQVCAPNL
jgi:hypothetical protein